MNLTIARRAWLKAGLASALLWRGAASACETAQDCYSEATSADITYLAKYNKQLLCDASCQTDTAGSHCNMFGLEPACRGCFTTQAAAHAYFLEFPSQKGDGYILCPTAAPTPAPTVTATAAPTAHVTAAPSAPLDRLPPTAGPSAAPSAAVCQTAQDCYDGATAADRQYLDQHGKELICDISCLTTEPPDHCNQFGIQQACRGCFKTQADADKYFAEFPSQSGDAYILCPTAAPTPTPTAPQTAKPTSAPISPTAAPTALDRIPPSAAPSALPSAAPTKANTATPTNTPTAHPTAALTGKPSAAPVTASPSKTPTAKPVATGSPTSGPTSKPSAAPSGAPVSSAPSKIPTVKPWATSSPTFKPTGKPTVALTGAPTKPNATSRPTAAPSNAPRDETPAPAVCVGTALYEYTNANVVVEESFTWSASSDSEAGIVSGGSVSLPGGSSTAFVLASGVLSLGARGGGTIGSVIAASISFAGSEQQWTIGNTATTTSAESAAITTILADLEQLNTYLCSASGTSVQSNPYLQDSGKDCFELIGTNQLKINSLPSCLSKAANLYEISADITDYLSAANAASCGDSGCTLDSVSTYTFPELSSDTTLVLNIRGTDDVRSLTLNGGWAVTGKNTAHNLLINICDIDTLTLGTVGVVGSILAPFTDVNSAAGGSSFDGQLFAKSFKGYTEFHSGYEFTGEVCELISRF